MGHETTPIAIIEQIEVLQNYLVSMLPKIKSMQLLPSKIADMLTIIEGGVTSLILRDPLGVDDLMKAQKALANTNKHIEEHQIKLAWQSLASVNLHLDNAKSILVRGHHWMPETK